MLSNIYVIYICVYVHSSRSKVSDKYRYKTNIEDFFRIRYSNLGKFNILYFINQILKEKLYDY